MAPISGPDPLEALFVARRLRAAFFPAGAVGGGRKKFWNALNKSLSILFPLISAQDARICQGGRNQGPLVQFAKTWEFSRVVETLSLD